MGRSINAYAFIAFPLAVLFLFTLAPTIAGLVLSLFQWDGSGTPTFVGLRNFRALLDDPRAGPAVINTLAFTILTVPASVALGFLIAVAVHARWFIGKATIRTMLFLPTIVSIIAIGFVWRWVLEDKGGLLPAAIRALGLAPPDFLNGDSIIRAGATSLLSWPMLSIIIVQVWRTIGFNMVLYLAALGSIGESLYEAAEIDGASRAQALRRITWPLVAPTTAFLMVTGVIGALQVFDIVWAMTAGNETMGTTVLNLSIYREFQQSRLGYASAIGVLIFGLTVVAMLLQWGVTRRGRPR